MMGSQDSTLVQAYSDASIGDTLLLEGTDIPYEFGGDLDPWNKSLVVIGIGINPQNGVSKRSIVKGRGSFSFYLGPNASGSRFYGLAFETNVETNTLTGAHYSNVSFYNCFFHARFQINGQLGAEVQSFSFINSIFESSLGNIILPGSGNSVLIENISIVSCVFNGTISGNNDNAFTVDHCLFLSPNSFINLVHHGIFKNSIFMNSSSPCSSCYFVVFYNNISRLSSSSNLQQFNNIVMNNIDNVDPKLANYTAGNLYSPTDDYHLLPISHARGAGLDGGDLGPHGSTTHFNESGEVLINPIVRSLIISNPNVTPSGTLDIQINATNPKDN